MVENAVRRLWEALGRVNDGRLRRPRGFSVLAVWRSGQFPAILFVTWQSYRDLPNSEARGPSTGRMHLSYRVHSQRRFARTVELSQASDAEARPFSIGVNSSFTMQPWCSERRSCSAEGCKFVVSCKCFARFGNLEGTTRGGTGSRHRRCLSLARTPAQVVRHLHRHIIVGQYELHVVIGRSK